MTPLVCTGEPFFCLGQPVLRSEEGRALERGLGIIAPVSTTIRNRWISQTALPIVLAFAVLSAMYLHAALR